MHSIKKLICFTLLLIFTYSFAAAGLLNLKINFENNSWREVLKKTYGSNNYKLVMRKGAEKCLEINHGIMLKTQKFPYYKGNIQVSFDAKTTDVKPAKRPYHVIWCSLFFFNAKGESIGHKDVLLTNKARDWTKYSLNIKNIRSDTASFQLRLGNAGKSGTLWIDNIAVNIKVNGRQLCGDPGFTGGFAVDHWNNPREGRDWDKLKLKSKNGSSKYVSGVFPDGGKSLHIKNNATFRSNQYAYNGAPLIFGAWVKHKNIKKGGKPWAWANIQLVIYDKDDNVIGHKDLTPLRTKKSEWNYYSRYIPAGAFRKDTAYLEIWPRCFEGATGDSWFDEIQLISLPADNINQQKYNAKTATVTIDAGKAAVKPIRPVWCATDISYASKIDHDVVKQILTELRNNGITHLRLREFMQGCRIFRKIDASGKPVFSWGKLDKIIDWAVNEQKFILTPTIESTPNQIATTPNKKAWIYCNRTAPTDFKLWGQIAQELVEHWIQRYGLETVSKWDFECWNEPCAETYYKGTRAEFLKIFNEYVDAMSRVEKKYNHSLNIGTLSGVNNSPFFKMVFDNLQKQGKLDRIKLVSMHIYAGFVNSFDALELGIRRIQKLIASYPELKGVPLILTEVNGSSMSHSGRDSILAAAFNVKANRVYLDTGVKRGYYFSPIDYMYRNKKRYFDGGSGLFTKNGVPKPAFNSVVLLNKLRDGKRLPLKSSNEPIDGISVIDANTLKILLTSFDERTIGKALVTKVSLKVNWPNTPANIKAVLYRVSKTDANSYSKWLQLGKPEINVRTDNILRKANKLKLEKFTGFKLNNHKLSVNLDIPNNSLIYLEFKAGK